MSLQLRPFSKNQSDALARRPVWPLLAVAIAAVMVVIGIIALGQYVWKQQRVTSLEQECRLSRDKGDWAAVARLAAIWADVRPHDADPWIFLAQAAESQGSLQRAAEYLDKLPNIDPKTIPALLERVDLLFGDLGQPLEAAKTCERILLIDPKSIDAHQRLTFFYAVTLQRKKMVEQARKAIEASCDIPETYVYLIGADWITLSNTATVNDRWLKTNPDQELYRVASALGYVNAHGLEESISEEEAALEIDTPRQIPEHEKRLTSYLNQFPENLGLLSYFLQQASTQGDSDTVARLLSSAPPEAQSDNRFWRFKGWLHAARGEDQEADQAFRKALELNPYDWAAQHQFAGVLRKTGHAEHAALMTQLSAEGRSLKKTILKQPDVRSIPATVLTEMAVYAAKCGDNHSANRLFARVREISQSGNSLIYKASD